MNRPLFALLSATLLAGCNSPIFPGVKGDVDGKAFLSTLDGPDVPTVDKTLLKTAQTQETSGDYASAAKTYRQLLDRQPEKVEYALLHAEALRRAGELDAAAAFYDKILENQPNNVAALEGSGLTLLTKGDFNRAGDRLATALNKDGNRWRTLNGLGILYAVNKDIPSARQYFARAQEKSSGNPSILNNLGLAFAMEKDFGQAADALSRAAASPNTNAQMRKRIEMNLALVYAASGRLEEAEAIAKQYFTGPALQNNLGLYAHLAQDDSLARTYFDMALTESKTYYDRAWQNRAALGKGESGASISAGGKRIVIPASTSPSARPGWESKLNPQAAAPVPATGPEAAPVQPVGTAEHTPSPSTMDAPAQAVSPAIATSAESPAKEQAETGAPELLGQSSEPTPAAPANVTPEKEELREGHAPEDRVDNGFEAMGKWIGGLR